MSFVGHINCSSCGFIHITDPSTVTIWWAYDAKEQLVEVICPGCKEKKESRLNLQDILAFKSHNVNLIPLGQKFEPLTTEAIDGWDCDREFASGLTKFV